MVTVGENCNFDALPSLVLITKILIPIIIGIPATFLIPNVLQTEPLIDWGSRKRKIGITLTSPMEVLVYPQVKMIALMKGIIC